MWSYIRVTMLERDKYQVKPWSSVYFHHWISKTWWWSIVSWKGSHSCIDEDEKLTILAFLLQFQADEQHNATPIRGGSKYGKRKTKESTGWRVMPFYAPTILPSPQHVHEKNFDTILGWRRSFSWSYCIVWGSTIPNLLWRKILSMFGFPSIQKLMLLWGWLHFDTMR
jgi:hypothetical protein